MYGQDYRSDYTGSDYTGLNSLAFDPATNNQPLEFSANSGPLVSDTPLENGAENSKKRKRPNPLPPEPIRNPLPLPDPPAMGPMLPSDPTAWATAMNNLGMAPMGMTGQPLMPDYDPSLGFAPMNPMMPGMAMVPPEMPVVKEIIHCPSCTLFPPNPNLPPPAMRARPPGCRTVFVGGLPENSSEQLIMELFGHCGEIIALRKSKKNFCHIRFAEEISVDHALFLSGYRVRLGSSTDKKDTGRLHVDFAQARDDLYEWECHQRYLAREERHRRRMEEDRFRPPSPPLITHYSDHECLMLGDKIKDDSQFGEAVRVLLTWVERGEVNRRNANNFYSMIQSSNSHIRRLMGEKQAHEKEMEDAKDKFKTAMAGILAQFEQIVSVFHAASKQRAWDHFSKAQRKNLDVWRKQAEEVRNMHNEEVMGIRQEEEMQMSDDDMEGETRPPNSKDSKDTDESDGLKEENDSLRCQLDAYRNEVELLKQEQGKNQPMSSEEETTRSQQLSFLQQALQGMQKQLMKMQEELRVREALLQRSAVEKKHLETQVQKLKEGLQNLLPVPVPGVPAVPAGQNLVPVPEPPVPGLPVALVVKAVPEVPAPAVQNLVSESAVHNVTPAEATAPPQVDSMESEPSSPPEGGVKPATPTSPQPENLQPGTPPTLQLENLLPENLQVALYVPGAPPGLLETLLSAPPPPPPPLTLESEPAASPPLGLHTILPEPSLSPQVESPKGDEGGTEEIILQTTEVTVPSVVSCSQGKEGPPPGPVSPAIIQSEREAVLVGIISTFLHVHPFGASIEYICSYLQRLDTKISPLEVELLLCRLPCTFRQELSGVGASLEKRWTFCGFQGLRST